MKMIRITPQLLNYSEEEKKIIYVYTLMNKGYNYDDKIILHDLTIDEVKEILDLNIPNIKEIITYKRVYPYEETIKSILGYIGNITKETKDYYLNKGYSLDDYVGVSGLEEQYESLLKGKKAKYFINSDNTLSKIEDEVLGNDLILNIDIDKVLFLEQTLKDELLLARTYKSATYFNHTYALISDPNNGAIIAIVGIKLNDDNTFSDISINAFTESYAMGSIVKGASMSVGYLNDAIDIGKMVKDSCVKLSNETPKCSYKYLGYVDDITALKTSSNYYQFITAIKVTGNNYIYNMKFMPTFKDFELYREIFRKYGLGAKSNIDFPIEYTGIKGIR
jgi:cell division protein FtsI/penicillin-binding protein 2